MVRSLGIKDQYCEVYEQGVRIRNDGEYRVEGR